MLFQGEPGHTRGIPAPLADAVRKDLSGIDNLVSFRYYSPERVSLPNEVMLQIHMISKATANRQPSTAFCKRSNLRFCGKCRQPALPNARPKPQLFKYQKHIIFADAHYFDLLPYRWIAGNKQSSLSQEGQVVLSESRAKLYFPKRSFADMIGQKIVYDDSISAHGFRHCGGSGSAGQYGF